MVQANSYGRNDCISEIGFSFDRATMNKKMQRVRNTVKSMQA